MYFTQVKSSKHASLRSYTAGSILVLYTSNIQGGLRINDDQRHVINELERTGGRTKRNNNRTVTERNEIENRTKTKR